MTRAYATVVLIALILGIAIGWALRAPVTPVSADPMLQVQLDSVRARAVVLEAAVARAGAKARADSIALARSRNVRVVAAPVPAGQDTAWLEPDSVTVYEVPAPVALKVLRLETSVASLTIERDSLALLNVTLKDESRLAASLQAKAEQQLAEERRRRWRYRLEGVGVGAGLCLVFCR